MHACSSLRKNGGESELHARLRVVLKRPGQRSLRKTILEQRVQMVKRPAQRCAFTIYSAIVVASVT